MKTKTLLTYALLIVVALCGALSLIFSAPANIALPGHPAMQVRAAFGLFALIALLIGALALWRLWPGRRRTRRRGRSWPHRPKGARAPQIQESPIEALFLRTWQQCYGSIPLVPQYQIGRYRVDFAHPPTKTAIELDGFKGHSSPAQIARDRRRQRELEALGWHFIRFGGREIFEQPATCARETYTFILRQRHNVYQ